MKGYIKNLLLFSVPFVMYLLIAVLVDPFNYYNIFSIYDSEYKEEVAMNVEQHLYKMMVFEGTPRRNLILGDSRSNNLAEVFDSNNWSNLAYGGGTIKEIVQTFWWVVDDYELDTVLIGVNFSNYNKYSKRFWVKETLRIKKNFISYSFNKFTFRAIFLIIKSLIIKEQKSLNTTSLSKDEFWSYQLSRVPKKYFGRYSYPDNYFLELKQISNFCIANNIKLILWIPPTHVEFQSLINRYNLKEEEEVFKTDLKSLGELFDFNYPNALTKDRDYFRDPLHVSKTEAVKIRNEILSGSSTLAKHSTP